MYPINRFRRLTCNTCHGTGDFLGNPCRKCLGLGYIFDSETVVLPPKQQICLLCRGTRAVPDPFTGRPVPCPQCRGLGYL
ncbi:MAG: hypothetical protein HC815_09835 [Richelia sp. RM1_1_1]|nr:hypothetical protein [Richelia sp. RM1_1_1]